MSHYRSNLRDIEFNLFEVLGRDRVLGTGPFEDVDEETARATTPSASGIDPGRSCTFRAVLVGCERDHPTKSRVSVVSRPDTSHTGVTHR